MKQDFYRGLFTKMKYRKMYGWIILFAASGWMYTTGYAQDLIQEIEQQNLKNFREEIFIQTDRDLYVSGETVWFGLRKTDAFSDHPDPTSKVVYLELLNGSGYPVIQQKLDTEGSTVSSALHLPDTLSTGQYLIRAYTRWMKNFNQTDFGFKRIKVVHPRKNPHYRYSETSQTDRILLFPEGGKLIPGIKTRVIVKALSKNGEPVSFSGVLTDGSGDTICKVTIHHGQGMFSITPESGTRYRLLTDPSGTSGEFTLNPADPKDFCIIRSPENNNKSGSIYKIAGGNISERFPGYLFLKKGGVLKYLKTLKDTDANLLKGVEHKLPEGISDILLTNDDGYILASRRIYVPFTESMEIRIDSINNFYNPREKVHVVFSVLDKNHHFTASKGSVTVTKSGLLNPDRPTLKTFETNKDFWLSGLTIPGSDINALYDFYPYPYSDTTRITSLTPDIRYIPELDGKILKGKVTDYNNDKPLIHAEMFLSFIGKNARDLFFRTDEQGNFAVNLTETGTRQIVIQPVDRETTNYYVDLEEDFLPNISHPLPGKYFPDTAQLGIIEDMIISKQVGDVFQTYPLWDTLPNGKSKSYSFYGEPVNRILLSDYIPLSTVREVIKEIVPHVAVQQRKGKSYIRMFSEYYDLELKNPLVLVDGTPYNDIDRLLKLPASEIEAIEVVNLRYFFENHIFQGVIHFITTRGNLEPLETDPGVFRLLYPVLQQSLSFKPTFYSDQDQHNAHRADFRNTLYWNPEISVGKDGKASFDFFTSDQTGKYTLFIEVSTDKGEKATLKKEFTVRYSPEK